QIWHAHIDARREQSSAHAKSGMKPPCTLARQLLALGVTLGREQVAELISFRSHVPRALAVLRLHDRDPVVNSQAVALDATQFAGVVGDGSNRTQTQVEQDLRADAVVSQVGLEAELLVGLDGVRAVILQLVRLELVEETDPAPLLVQVYDDTASL